MPRIRDQNRPNIYKYHDFKSVLRDWFEYLGTINPEFSLRKLASQLKFSASYIPLALSGKRTMTKKIAEKIAKEIGLTKAELEYFMVLWELGNTTSDEGRTMVLEKVQKFAFYKTLNAKEIETFRYLTRWYFVAIREMHALPGFKLDPKWIRKQLKKKVSAVQIKEAIDFLLKNNFLALSEDGSVTAPEKHIRCMTPVYEIALKENHGQMLMLSKDSLEYSVSQERYHRGSTFSVSQADLPKIKEIIEEAIVKIREVHTQSRSPDGIYQLEFTTFPLALLEKKTR